MVPSPVLIHIVPPGVPKRLYRMMPVPALEPVVSNGRPARKPLITRSVVDCADPIINCPAADETVVEGETAEANPISSPDQEMTVFWARSSDTDAAKRLKEIISTFMVISP